MRPLLPRLQLAAKEPQKALVLRLLELKAGAPPVSPAFTAARRAYWVVHSVEAELLWSKSRRLNQKNGARVVD